MSIGYGTTGNGKDMESTSSSRESHEPVDIDLLAAENVIFSDDIIDSRLAYSGPFGRMPGRLVVTRYRLCFFAVDSSRQHETWKLDIPLGHIARIDKHGKRSQTPNRMEESYGMSVVCKDLRVYRFVIQHVQGLRKSICDAIMEHSFPMSNDSLLFAFHHGEKAVKPENDGWKIFSHEKEFERLGLVNHRLWTISTLNSNYKFCDTYPKLFVIPTASAEMGTPFLKQVGEFRSKSRIPVLSWFDKTSLASINRASQPMCGIAGKKKEEDEAHLKNIMDANGNSYTLLIFDARPHVNAQVNRARGGGYEDNYERSSLTFLDIHNIHVVRESMKKLISAILPKIEPKGEEIDFHKTVDESKWLMHIQSILEGSHKIVYNIEHAKQSVLVHCSDGWDRTAQLTALSMLQLDKYYRTLEGFIVLIEKEWCSFGHKFGQRVGHGDDKFSDNERAPIFVQFFDCVWQIMIQFPSFFEFRTSLLVLILDELYSCRYGTFLFNSEKSRLVENKCAEKTVSLWTYVLENRDKYTSRLYREPKGRGVLHVNTALSRIRVWSDYYARANPHAIAPRNINVQHPLSEEFVEKEDFLDDIQTLEDATQKLQTSV